VGELVGELNRRGQAEGRELGSEKKEWKKTATKIFTGASSHGSGLGERRQRDPVVIGFHSNHKKPYKCNE
jgi:hypothetical protein